MKAQLPVTYGSRNTRTLVIDLAEDGHYLALYKTHPYFADVLEWLSEIRPIGAIRHNHSDEDFRRRVLPEVLSLMKREDLVRVVRGRLRPTFKDVYLKNIPRDSETASSIVASEIDALLDRSLQGRLAPKIDVVRTRVSLEQIREWRRRIIHIFDEIETHDEPPGLLSADRTSWRMSSLRFKRRSPDVALTTRRQLGLSRASNCTNSCNRLNARFSIIIKIAIPEHILKRETVVVPPEFFQ